MLSVAGAAQEAKPGREHVGAGVPGSGRHEGQVGPPCRLTSPMAAGSRPQPAGVLSTGLERAPGDCYVQAQAASHCSLLGQAHPTSSCCGCISIHDHALSTNWLRCTLLLHAAVWKQALSVSNAQIYRAFVGSAASSSINWMCCNHTCTCDSCQAFVACIVAKNALHDTAGPCWCSAQPLPLTNTLTTEPSGLLTTMQVQPELHNLYIAGSECFIHCLMRQAVSLLRQQQTTRAVVAAQQAFAAVQHVRCLPLLQAQAAALLGRCCTVQTHLTATTGAQLATSA